MRLLWSLKEQTERTRKKQEMTAIIQDSWDRGLEDVGNAEAEANLPGS